MDKNTPIDGIIFKEQKPMEQEYRQLSEIGQQREHC